MNFLDALFRKGTLASVVFAFLILVVVFCCHFSIPPGPTSISSKTVSKEHVFNFRMTKDYRHILVPNLPSLAKEFLGRVGMAQSSYILGRVDYSNSTWGKYPMEGVLTILDTYAGPPVPPTLKLICRHVFGPYGIYRPHDQYDEEGTKPDQLLQSFYFLGVITPVGGAVCSAAITFHCLIDEGLANDLRSYDNQKFFQLQQLCNSQGKLSEVDSIAILKKNTASPFAFLCLLDTLLKNGSIPDAGDFNSVLLLCNNNNTLKRIVEMEGILYGNREVKIGLYALLLSRTNDPAITSSEAEDIGLIAEVGNIGPDIDPGIAALRKKLNVVGFY